MGGSDATGDGKADSYSLHGELEDHDGDGAGDDPLDDKADDLEGLKADLSNEMEAQNQWLVAHGR